MIFWKSAKGEGGGGVIFNPKNYIADFGPLSRALRRAFSEKNAIRFSEIEGKVKGCLEFSRKFICFGHPSLSMFLSMASLRCCHSVSFCTCAWIELCCLDEESSPYLGSHKK